VSFQFLFCIVSFPPSFWRRRVTMQHYSTLMLLYQHWRA
jgi:hypothetical protein